MPSEERSAESGYVASGDALAFELKQLETERRQQQDESVAPRSQYELLVRGKPISLTYIEYRIVQVLVKRPYYAFTRRQIVEAVSTADTPVTEASLDRHVTSLRHKLGMFSDYIQSVPYIGYRFKQ